MAPAIALGKGGEQKNKEVKAMKPKRFIPLVIERKPVQDIQRLILAEEERLERLQKVLTRHGWRAVEAQILAKKFA